MTTRKTERVMWPMLAALLPRTEHDAERAEAEALRAAMILNSATVSLDWMV